MRLNVIEQLLNMNIDNVRVTPTDGTCRKIAGSFNTALTPQNLLTQNTISNFTHEYIKFRCC